MDLYHKVCEQCGSHTVVSIHCIRILCGIRCLELYDARMTIRGFYLYDVVHLMEEGHYRLYYTETDRLVGMHMVHVLADGEDIAKLLYGRVRVSGTILNLVQS